MSFKLDVSKAYDQISWSFLKEVMMKMGLNLKLIEFVMGRVTTVSYLVLINGDPHDIQRR